MKNLKKIGKILKRSGTKIEMCTLKVAGKCTTYSLQDLFDIFSVWIIRS